MKKKSGLVLASTIGAISMVVGCGADTYRYEVSGTVEERQIDYDCPGEDVAIEPVGFQAGRSKPKPKPKNNTSDDASSADSPTAAPKTERPSRTSAPIAAPTRTGSPTKAPKGGTKGVELKEKPAKPVKIPKFLKAAIPISLVGCKEEPELFVRNADGLFEQDVRREDFDKCLKGDVFPACTEK